MVNQSVIDSSVDLEQLKDIEDLIPDMDKAISEKVETFLDKSGDQPYAHMNEGYVVVVEMTGEMDKMESVDCEKRQEQIKIQNRQNYEKYHEGQMNQNQFMEAKKQLEEERERLQKRVQELGELINSEKEILMKKNVPVEQMLKYLGYEKLTREMLEEYVQGIYVYDDGRVEVEWKELSNNNKGTN